MPTYDYKCEDCEYAFETFHSMSQDPLKKCPKCSKDTLKRLIGGQNATLKFKGSGFYITDYKNSTNDSSKKSE